MTHDASRTGTNDMDNVYWHQGMLLQPQHFQLAELHQQFRFEPWLACGPPHFWGVGALSLAQAAIDRRVVEIRSTRLLFADRSYVEYPGNAVVAARAFDPAWLDEGRALVAHVALRRLARGANGASAVFPLAQNTHHGGILSLSVVPAPAASDALVREAQQAAVRIADSLGYVGVLCVEFFVLEDGSLVANEMAPRPPNSGHYAVDASETSDFEQPVRAMTRLPLGSTRQHSPAAMLNVLGDVWFANGVSGEPVTPPWDEVAAMPTARLHLYGKEEARAGRKMGHVNFTAATRDEAVAGATACARLLRIALD